MYRNSSLYQRASNGDILKEPVERIVITDICPYLVGNSAYHTAPWLIKPYPGATLDPGEITFNKELSSARVAIECAFGRLKSRWRNKYIQSKKPVLHECRVLLDIIITV